MKKFEYGGLIVQPNDDPSLVAEALKSLSADSIKGDVPGHEFHGNQWGSVAGGKSDAEHAARLTQAASDAKARGNSGAAKEWANHARNLKGNDEVLKQDARMASMSIQDKPSSSQPHMVGYQSAASTVLRDAGATKRGGDELKSSLQRKDFEAIATHIRGTVPEEHQQGVARAVAERLKSTNPLFNTERFVNASTGQGSQTPGRLGHTSSTAAGIRQAARDMGRNAPEPKGRQMGSSNEGYGSTNDDYGMSGGLKSADYTRGLKLAQIEIQKKRKGER